MEQELCFVGGECDGVTCDDVARVAEEADGRVMDDPVLRVVEESEASEFKGIATGTGQ
jgi:hypothetical protein